MAPAAPTGIGTIHLRGRLIAKLAMKWLNQTANKHREMTLMHFEVVEHPGDFITGLPCVYRALLHLFKLRSDVRLDVFGTPTIAFTGTERLSGQRAEVSRIFAQLRAFSVGEDSASYRRFV